MGHGSVKAAGRSSAVGADRACKIGGGRDTGHETAGAGRESEGAVAGHDEAWFDELFRAHAGAVRRYFLRRAPVDAEDLAAETLALAWRRRDDVPDGAELPWLYRSAGYLLANHRRKRAALLVEELPETPDLTDPADLAVTDDTVRRALAAISDRDREVLLLHAWEGLTGEGLAEALGISRSGADAALSRARSRLALAWAGE
ncbi:MAG: sigma-70 family RNA polymerase sigma factor [Actinobacteria bacterium]|nr:sigma-70 family RNA polymerase sigma factor [Actinomycetota bacterium]